MNKLSASSIVLTFHGVRDPSSIPERPIAQSVARYFVRRERLEQVLTAVCPRSSCTASEFVAKVDGRWTVLTFDDGLITDFEVSFPQLTARGLRATFFVNVENVGKKGYAELAQLRQMTECGMEIGSHGLTHRYLLAMTRSEATREICDSKSRLQDLLGIEVASFAPVGGHYASWMTKVAAEAGYRVFATMIPGRCRNVGSPILLHRNHVQAHHTPDYVLRVLCGDRRTFLINRLRYMLLKLPKTLFGMRRYDQMKRIVVRLHRTSRNGSDSEV